MGSSWLTFPHPRRTSEETRHKTRCEPRSTPHAHNCDADGRINDDTGHDIDRQADDDGDGTCYDSHGRDGRHSADGGPDCKVCQKNAGARGARLVREAVNQVLARPAAGAVVSAPARDEGVCVGVGRGKWRGEGFQAGGLLNGV